MADNILEQLRLDRQAREQRRQDDLKQYEAELANRRERRRQDRLGVRQTERRSDRLISSLHHSTNLAGVKTTQARTAGNEMKLREIETSQRSLNSRRDLDRMTFAAKKKRMMELRVLRRRRKIPPPVKRYTVHPAEFYGIDFSPQSQVAELQSELHQLAKQREQELLADPMLTETLALRGQAFIQALAETTKLPDGQALQEWVRIKREKGLIASNGNTCSTALSTFGTGSANGISATEEDRAAEQKREAELTLGDTLNDFVRRIPDTVNIRPDDQLIEPDAKIRAGGKRRLKFVRPAPKIRIDYSEYFPENRTISTTSGLTVYRIENLAPKRIVLGEDTGRLELCKGDCYVIVNTTETADGKLETTVIQWVGDLASLDKKACSAIFSVGLRDLLSNESQITREECGAETAEFKLLLAGNRLDLVHTDASKASQSALYKVQERDYPLLMYQVQSSKRTVKHDGNEEMRSGATGLQLVELNPNRLKSDGTFLIDAGAIVYQWTGNQAKLTDRAKCKLFAQRISKFERPPGKCEMFEVREGREPEEFWDVFNGERRQVEEPLVMVASNEGSLNTFQALVESSRMAPIILYELTDAKGSISKLSIDSLIKFQSTKSQRLPSRSLLSGDSCYVLDCHSELFLWLGRKSSINLRSTAEGWLIEKIFPLERPSYANTAKLMEGAESEAFKARFPDWDEQIIRRVDYNSEAKPPGPLKSHVPRELIKADIKAIYTSPPTGKVTPEEEQFTDKLFDQANSLLVSMATFIFDKDKRKFIRLNTWNGGCKEDFNCGGDQTTDEKGHLWSRETYIFLCVYRRQQLSEDQQYEADMMSDAVLSFGSQISLQSSTSMASLKSSMEEINLGTSSASLGQSFHSLNQFPVTKAVEGSAVNSARLPSGSYHYLSKFRANAAAASHNSSVSFGIISRSPSVHSVPQQSPAGFSSAQRGDQDSQPCENECVIYLWTGSYDSQLSMGQLIFEHDFRYKIAEMIRKVHGGKIEIKVVHLRKEKESLALLAHFGRRCVVHQGRRKELTIKKPPHSIRLYHIRTDLRYKVTRAFELAPVISSLVTRDVFLLLNGSGERIDHGSAFLWVGKGASKEEERQASALAENIVSFLNCGGENIDNKQPEQLFSIVREKSEPEEFWRLLGPSYQRPRMTPKYPIPYGQGYYYSKPPPRFFRCSTDCGYYHVEDLGIQFNRGDLLNESLYILDSGPGLGKPYRLWVWIGRDVSDVVVKLSKKTVDSYLGFLKDGRSMDGSVWDETEGEEEKRKRAKQSVDVWIIEQGKEPVDFKAFFLGWGDDFTIDEIGREVLQLTPEDVIYSQFKVNQPKEKDK